MYISFLCVCACEYRHQILLELKSQMTVSGLMWVMGTWALCKCS